MKDISGKILDLLVEQGPLQDREICEQLQKPDSGMVTASLQNLKTRGAIALAWFSVSPPSPREQLLADIRQRVLQHGGPPVARMAFEIKDSAEVLLTAATGGDTESAMEAAMSTAALALEYAVGLVSYGVSEPETPNDETMD